MTPLCIDLFCGSFGWSTGWLSLGGRVVGFDLEHLEHHGPVPVGAELVIQDVATIHGSQFRNASLILASPPCPEFSWMAMPWSRGRQVAAALLGKGEFPEGYTGSRTIPQLTALFDACFRIQREASAAAGRHVPMVVENVCGAQPWVGRAKWHHGSYYLWGDVPALMPIARKRVAKVTTMGAGWYPPDHPKHVAGLAFNTHAERATVKCQYAHTRKTRRCGASAVGQTTGMSGRPVDVCLKHAKLYEQLRVAAYSGIDRDGDDGVKIANRTGPAWFDEHGATSSKSTSRKAASARIAKIPLALSAHIAECYLASATP